MIHYCRYLFVKMKVFNYSELHFSEVTSYKIHTLIASYVTLREFYFNNALAFQGSETVNSTTNLLV